jgi:hypothetical protein
LRVNAESTETNPDDGQGTFTITYPGDPDVARDNTYVRVTIRCMAVTGNEALLVGRIGSASGLKADNGNFEEGECVRIGVLDNATQRQGQLLAGRGDVHIMQRGDPNLQRIALTLTHARHAYASG